MTVEMATGHTLRVQHIGKLDEAQKAANVNRRELQSKVNNLEGRVNALQKEVARLTALVEKFLPKRKWKTSGKQQKGQS